MTASSSFRHSLPSGHALPLWWCRIPFLWATVGLSCVCIAVGIQALDRSTKLENSIRETAQNTGTTIMFDMNDIKSTSIVLTLVAFLILITSSVFSVSLTSDFVSHLRRPQDNVNTKVRSLDGDDEKTQTVRRLPFSTRTLPYQTICLSFLSVWLLAVLIPSTLFSRTGSAHLTIMGNSSNSLVSIDPVYWDYGFLRCLAAAPWFTLVFSAPASTVSWVAWKYYPTMTNA